MEPERTNSLTMEPERTDSLVMENARTNSLTMEPERTDSLVNETDFFHSLGLQTTDRAASDECFISAGERDVVEGVPSFVPGLEGGAVAHQGDQDMSFIDAIGLYWLNPATDKDPNWMRNHELEGGQGPADQDTQPDVSQVDELDFLSVLGLTRVETTEPRRWRLWHPEDEVDEVPWLGSGDSILPGGSAASTLLEATHTDPTVMEVQANLIGKKLHDGRESGGNENKENMKTHAGFHCRDCNRTLASEELLRRHLASELHFKHSSDHHYLNNTRQRKPNSLYATFQTEPNVLEENRPPNGEKRKPDETTDLVNDDDNEDDDVVSDDDDDDDEEGKGEEVLPPSLVQCESCGARVQKHQVPKHLISHFHYHRSIGHPATDRLILENLPGIVHQSPFQCQPCQFYCNWHKDLVIHIKNHSTSLTNPSSHVIKPPDNDPNVVVASFWCIICMRILSSHDALVEHLGSEDHLELISVINRSVPAVIKQINLHHCAVCYKEFRLNIGLKKHMKWVHGVQEFELENHTKYPCSYCPYWTYKQKSIQLHTFRVHPQKGLEYKCAFCSKEFKNLDNLKQHRSTGAHKENVSRFQNPAVELSRNCAFCDQQLQGIEKLKLHMQSSHLRLLPQCNMCGEIFYFSQQLKGHVKLKCRTESGIPRYVGEHSCAYCNFSTASEARLCKHRRYKHKDRQADPTPQHRCEDCFRRFLCRELLDTHIQKYHKVSELFACSEEGCGYTTPKKKLYHMHLRRKHGNKDEVFPCPQCSKVYQTRTSLKHHTETVHNVERCKQQHHVERKTTLLTCDFSNCEFSSAFPSDLDRHKSKHFSEKSFFCQNCEFSCKRKSELTRHFKMKHTETAPLKCDLCSYTTKNPSHIKRHKRLVHEKGGTKVEAKTTFMNVDPASVVVVSMLDNVEEQVIS